MSEQKTHSQKPTLVTTGSTIEITAKIVSVLKPLFEGEMNELDRVTTVERHKKRFDKVEDIKREVTGSGCVRIVALNVGKVQRSAGNTIGNVKFIAFVMTNDQYGKNRSQRAELIANQLGLAVLKPSFSQVLGDIVHAQVDESSWQNLSTVDLDKIGVSMWAVEWQQMCRFDAGITTASPEFDLLDDFLTVGMTVNTTDAVIDENGDSDTPQIKAEIELQKNQTAEDIP